MVKSQFLIVVCSLILACAPPQQASSPPNVVVISIDSLRQDRLGCYGHTPQFADGIEVSPNIDNLAKSGLQFENAFTSTSWTLPSHAALMTGLSDRLHGVETASFKIDPQHEVLAEVFQNAGWETFGVYSHSFLEPRHGFSRGFDQYRSAILDEESCKLAVAEEMKLIEEQVPGIEWNAKRLKRLRKIILRYQHRGEQVSDTAIEFLETANDDKPFFLFAHYFDVHHDYLPERTDPEIAHSFDPHYKGMWTGKDWAERAISSDTRKAMLGGRDLAHVMAMYDAEIHLVDRQIGRIFNWLKENSLWDNTIVVLVSDHGEEFFDHGGITHASNLHNELIRVPLIIKPAQHTTAELSGVTKQVVAIQDIAPTLLQLCDIQNECNNNTFSLLAKDSERGVISRLQVFSPDGKKENVRDSWRDGDFSVLRLLQKDTNGNLAVAVNPQTGHAAILIYDLNADPLEKSPLKLTDPRVTEALQAFHKDLIAEEAASLQVKLSPIANRLANARTSEEANFLEALGYLVPVSDTEHRQIYSSFPLPLMAEQ